MNVRKTSNSKYTIDNGRNLCEIVVEGNEGVDTIFERYNVILNDKEWCPGINVIVDITKVHKLAFSGQDLEILAYHHSRLADKIGDSILCFITNQGYMYGIGRILESLTALGGQKVHVCRSKDEAMRIIRNQERKNSR
jgi:hypothetical protein